MYPLDKTGLLRTHGVLPIYSVRRFLFVQVSACARSWRSCGRRGCPRWPPACSRCGSRSSSATAWPPRCPRTGRPGADYHCLPFSTPFLLCLSRARRGKSPFQGRSPLTITVLLSVCRLSLCLCLRTCAGSPPLRVPVWRQSSSPSPPSATKTSPSTPHRQVKPRHRVCFGGSTFDSNRVADYFTKTGSGQTKRENSRQKGKTTHRQDAASTATRRQGRKRHWATASRRRCRRRSPRRSENGLFEPFLYKNDHFAKTGSGQI